MSPLYDGRDAEVENATGEEEAEGGSGRTRHNSR